MVAGGRGDTVADTLLSLCFLKADVVGASYKRRHTSDSHANGEGDLEKRGRMGEMCY